MGFQFSDTTAPTIVAPQRRIGKKAFNGSVEALDRCNNGPSHTKEKTHPLGKLSHCGKLSPSDQGGDCRTA